MKVNPESFDEFYILYFSFLYFKIKQHFRISIEIGGFY